MELLKVRVEGVRRAVSVPVEGATRMDLASRETGAPVIVTLSKKVAGPLTVTSSTNALPT